MDSIIFDVDGTLWDATAAIAASWDRVVKKEGLSLTIDRARLEPELGKLVPDIFASLFPGESAARQEELLELCTKSELQYLVENCPPLFPDLKDTIQLLSAKYKLFIVSNCQAGYIEAFLQATGLGRNFVNHLCPGDTGRPKAQNIRMIVDQYNLESPIYVGDTQGDADSCSAAGIPFVYASYGLGTVMSPDYTIEKLSDLISLMEEDRLSILN